MSRAYSTHGEIRNVHRIVVANAGRKRPLGRSRNRCEYNIKMDLRGIGM
jgi:hypothetical protein